MQVEVYTIKNCNSCKEAKAYLTEKKIRFKEVDMSIGGVPEVQEKKKYFKEIGLKTYPVTIVDTNPLDYDKNSLLIKKRCILQGFDEKEFDEVFEDGE